MRHRRKSETMRAYPHYMTLLRAAFLSALFLIGVTVVGARAAGETDYLLSREHCETQCTLGVQTCQSAVSEEVDACLSNCDQGSCSKCNETMDTDSLEKCDAACSECRHQCDESFDTKRQSCDSSEQTCLSKCMGSK